VSDPELERVYEHMLARIKPRAGGPPPLRHPCPHGARKSHCEKCQKARRVVAIRVRCPHGIAPKHACETCMREYARQYYLKVRKPRREKGGL